MDAACEAFAPESSRESKKLRKDSNSVSEEASMLSGGRQKDALAAGMDGVSSENHCSAFEEQTVMVRNEHENKTKKKIVYIWDMDETLILLKSLLNGKYAEPFNGSKDIQHGIKIGRRWERLILQLCDECFFYEQVENFNEPNLDAWCDYDDGMDLSNYDFSNDGLAQPCDDANKRKLAYRHRVTGNKYAQGLHKLLDAERLQIWQDLYDVTNAYTDGWLSTARTFLEECLKAEWVSGPGDANTEGNKHLSATEEQNSSQNVNVLVTSGTLIPSLVKCLLFQLNGLITHDNVYSSWDVGKLQCFLWIKKRFEGPGVQFCVIGDSLEECQAAENLGWPFVKIDPQPEGWHRFPGLSISTLKHYMDCVYGNSESDDER